VLKVLSICSAAAAAAAAARYAMEKEIRAAGEQHCQVAC
jgi:hypothetical protein